MCKVSIKVTFGLRYLWLHPKRDFQATLSKYIFPELALSAARG